MSASTKPAGFNTVVSGNALHRDCGGRVSRGEVYFGMFSDELKCAKCSRTWSVTILTRMSEADIRDRFVQRPEVDPNAYALVWVADSITKRRHTRLVPLAEAEGLERAVP